MIKILLVEDDKTIVANLTEYLNGAGYIVRSVSGQSAAIAVLAEERADLVLLDVSLAEGNGFSACRAIKSEFDLPVIFLTASGDEYSTVTGFDLGADDYIPKPFRPRELLSRIKNVLRLTGSTGKTVKLGDVVVDTEKGTAMKNNKDLFLSALEYRLLLADHSRRIPFDPYGLSYIWTAASPCRAGDLSCVTSVYLRCAVFTEVLQKAKTVVLCTRTPASCCCREADAVFPRRISVRDQPLARYGGYGGNRKD